MKARDAQYLSVFIMMMMMASDVECAVADQVAGHRMAVYIGREHLTIDAHLWRLVQNQHKRATTTRSANQLYD